MAEQTVPGADPASVGGYLARVLGDEAWREPTVTLIAGGRSNLTYRVVSPAGRAILRRPPLGHVLPTAHDMVREHTVITALRDTEVPVPRTLALCTDEAVLGAPFYVMEEVPGHVVRDALPASVLQTEVERGEITDRLVDVLAALHAVDPAAVGLAGFGRPEGYLARQLRRWSAQWEATRVGDDGGVDALAGRLRARVPTAGDPAVIHGDYRLDNVLVAPAPPPRVAAVLDWEMSTLGDPLADVGLLLVYWQQADDDDERAQALVVASVTRLPGFPGREQIAERYADATGRDLGALAWYVAFGFFKLAVVCAGIAARGRAGVMVGEGFVEAEQRVAPLSRLGHRVLDQDAPW